MQEKAIAPVQSGERINEIER